MFLTNPWMIRGLDPFRHSRFVSTTNGNISRVVWTVEVFVKVVTLTLVTIFTFKILRLSRSISSTGSNTNSPFRRDSFSSIDSWTSLGFVMGLVLRLP